MYDSDIPFVAPKPMSGQHMVHLKVSKENLSTQKINCIKFVRSLTGWGLKESKDFVEDLNDNQAKKSPYSALPFSVPTLLSPAEIEERANGANITVEIMDAIQSVPPDFKGCFNMVSPTRVHLYLENGDNNKLSMDVDIHRMQEFITLFLENTGTTNTEVK